MIRYTTHHKSSNLGTCEVAMRKKTEALIPASFFLGNKHHLGTPDDLGAMLCQALNAHLKLKMFFSGVSKEC
jgi:hypothetical protein